MRSTDRNVILEGQYLTLGGFISSSDKDKDISLKLDNDGDLQLTISGQARWHSGTANKSVSSAVMEPSGNFVLYSSEPEPEVIWSSRSAGNPGSKLVLKDDCYFEVINPAGQMIIRSESSCRNSYSAWSFVKLDDY